MNDEPMDSGVDWKGKGNDVQHAVEPVRGRGEKVSKMRDNIPKSSVIIIIIILIIFIITLIYYKKEKK